MAKHSWGTFSNLEWGRQVMGSPPDPREERLLELLEKLAQPAPPSEGERGSQSKGRKGKRINRGANDGKAGRPPLYSDDELEAFAKEYLEYKKFLGGDKFEYEPFLDWCAEEGSIVAMNKKHAEKLRKRAKDRGLLELEIEDS